MKMIVNSLEQSVEIQTNKATKINGQLNIQQETVKQLQITIQEQNAVKMKLDQ